MLRIYLLFSLIVFTSCDEDGDWLNCKPKPGCSITRCDPKPGWWFGHGAEPDEYSILCQNKGNSVGSETSSKIADFEKSLLKLEGRIERSEKMDMDLNFEIVSLERRNEELKKDIAKITAEAESTTKLLRGELKRMKSQFDEMKEENDDLKKKFEEFRQEILKRIERTQKPKIGRARGASYEENEETIEASKSSGTKPPTKTCYVKYENNCFQAFTEQRKNYEGAIAECEAHGGHLANIHRQTTMDEIMQYVRQFHLHSSQYVDLRLGMRYENGKLLLRDGSEVQSDLKWFVGYPFIIERTPKWNNVILKVQSDPKSNAQYLLNQQATSRRFLLCEIPWN